MSRSPLRGTILPVLLLLALALGCGGAALASTEPPKAPLSPLDALIKGAEERIAKANAADDVKGTGPYPAEMETDLALPNATIYRPADLTPFSARRLGVVIWGNGGCSNDGASARLELSQIASYGYLVLAPGKPLTGPYTVGTIEPRPMTTTVQDMRGLLDWAVAENGRLGSPYYRRIDTRAIAAAGHSCGAMQAIILADDPRVKTVIIHNSGLELVVPDNPPLVSHIERLRALRRSVLIVSGGTSDILWRVSNDTFGALADGERAMVWAEVGHGGTFAKPHGGRAAEIAVNWLQWKLRGDKAAAKTFVGSGCGLCSDSEWKIRKKGFK